MLILGISIHILFASVTAPINAQQYQNSIHIGINVNWAMNQKEIAAYNAQKPKDFKAMGFDYIRLRFTDPWRLHMDQNRYIAHLHRVVQDSLRNGLKIILSYDAEEVKRNPNSKNFSRFVGFWRRIAAEFRSYPADLAFDLMVEPAKKIVKMPNTLNRLYATTIHAIRATNPTRIISLAPPKPALPESLRYLRIPKEEKKFIMAQIHLYDAGPSKTDPNKLWTTGTQKERRIFVQRLEKALAWQKHHRIPIWIGAIMPGDYNHGNHYTIKEQADFATYFSCLLRRYKIPFTVKAGHLFYDYAHKKWHKDRIEVVRAIVHPICNLLHQESFIVSGVRVYRDLELPSLDQEYLPKF